MAQCLGGHDLAFAQLIQMQMMQAGSCHVSTWMVANWRLPGGKL